MPVTNTWQYSPFNLGQENANFSEEITPKIEILEFANEPPALILETYQSHDLVTDNHADNGYSFNLFMYQSNDNKSTLYPQSNSIDYGNFFDFFCTTDNFQLLTISKKRFNSLLKFRYKWLSSSIRKGSKCRSQFSDFKNEFEINSFESKKTISSQLDN